MDTHFYNLHLKWTEGRKGSISSPDIRDTMEVATPPQFPNGVEGIWSPEHLLTAAVTSCFMTTFLAIAENSRLAFKSFECGGSGKLEQVEGKLLMTEIILEPILVLEQEADKEKAERVLVKSEKACLISNSIKSKVSMTTTVKWLEPA